MIILTIETIVYLTHARRFVCDGVGDTLGKRGCALNYVLYGLAPMKPPTVVRYTMILTIVTAFKPQHDMFHAQGLAGNQYRG